LASGPVISGAGHGLLLLSFLIGGLFQRAPEEALETADVSVITSEEFAALTNPALAPSATTETPEPEAPVQDTPVPVPEPEVAPDVPEPPVATETEAPDPTPEVVEPPVPEPEVVEETPQLVEPDTPAIDVPVPAPPSDSPAPLPAPRVAPIPVPETPPAPEMKRPVLPLPHEALCCPWRAQGRRPLAPNPNLTPRRNRPPRTPRQATALRSMMLWPMRLARPCKKPQHRLALRFQAAKRTGCACPFSNAGTPARLAPMR